MDRIKQRGTILSRKQTCRASQWVVLSIKRTHDGGDRNALKALMGNASLPSGLSILRSRVDLSKKPRVARMSDIADAFQALQRSRVILMKIGNPPTMPLFQTPLLTSNNHHVCAELPIQDFQFCVATFELLQT